MSDVRALLSGRDIPVNDGAYLERADKPPLLVEEMLRSAQARLAFLFPQRVEAFLQHAAAAEAAARALSDEALAPALRQAVQPMRREGFKDELVAKAFAVIREASRRTLGMRHHDVQLLAGRTLLQGRIAELATGEGKTLAATLASCTAAATGAAVHVVTVNDYLAGRDAEQNTPLFTLLGFSAGTVIADMSPEDRRAQYARDIVYVSNKELTFDYLKDQLAVGSLLDIHRKLRRLRPGGQHSPALLRGLHVAIVDEVDSVLIDEARTPLIISETLPDDLDLAVYSQGIELAKQLTAPAHFIAGKDKSIWLTRAGVLRTAELTDGLDTIWTSPLWRKELVQKALSALHSFHRDQHYIIAEDKVQIVDEFTGRVMADRTWERGLHQMIEAKEGCEITGQRRTLAQITYQRFFGRYLLLAGMTGTAQEVEPELKRVYDLSMTRIPTHKPSRRQRWPDQVFANDEARWQAVAQRAAELAGQGRAVLIGSRSVAASETLDTLLTARGVTHRVLNARQDETEAESVALAGQPGAITVATNMAGRGTDIKLAKEVEAKGGLHVILTEFHESGRVDRQLFGRSARQGDPGSVEAMVCWRDEVFVRFAPWLSLLARRLMGRRTRAGIAFKWLVAYAQWKSEREGRRERLETVKRDRKWLEALGFVGKANK